MAWLENKILFQITNENTKITRSLSTAIDLTAVILQEEKFNQAATAFTTEFATKLNCDRVSIGFIKNKKSKIAALSHSASYGKDTNLVGAIEEAMDECSDQHETINYPPKDENNHQILLAHKKLALKQGNNAVCTIPFINQHGSIYGAISLERSGEKPFDPRVIEFCENVVLLAAPVLWEKKNNDKNNILRLFESCTHTLKTIMGAGHFTQKLSFACLVTLVIFFYFATGEFRVSANAVIEGSIQRALVAPYNGYILEAFSRAGDVKKTGDILCKLDDNDLQLERLSWLSTTEQYQRQMREAMATNNRARMNVITEQINQANAQLALLNEQISRSVIKAPFDGIVVSGDISQSLGTPVERGEVLFEMAPLDSYRVILKVDETDIDEIKTDQIGSILLTSFPDHPLPIKIETVTPVSTTQGGKTYFQVEAALLEQVPELRPGMEGFGKIQIEQRSLIWIWTHDIMNWIRIRLWSVFP